MLVGLVGPPCAGKRAVCAVLADKLNFVVVQDYAELLRRDGLMRCWREHEHVVIYSVSDADVQKLCERPFFLLVAVDAPLLCRFRRSLDAAADAHGSGGGADSVGGATERRRLEDRLEKFLAQNDDAMFGASRRAVAMRSAHARLLNDHASIAKLTEDVLGLQLERLAKCLRPSWDAYFMGIARMLAERTNCVRQRIAAVIVRDTRVISTGYTGTPRRVANCYDGGCRYCAQEAEERGPLDLCVCVCAEESAIVEAGRARCLGADMYVTRYPCLSCARKIKQAGVCRVVYERGENARSAQFLAAANVAVQCYVGDELGMYAKNAVKRVDLSSARFSPLG